VFSVGQNTVGPLQWLCHGHLVPVGMLHSSMCLTYSLLLTLESPFLLTLPIILSSCTGSMNNRCLVGLDVDVRCCAGFWIKLDKLHSTLILITLEGSCLCLLV
jgi:hypothetical protein